MERTLVGSLDELLTRVKEASSSWGDPPALWFRGEPAVTSFPLIPRVFRNGFPENDLLHRFRLKAPTLGIGQTPPRNHTDEWLFLAQHVGLPTRLLDWTESLLAAVYFAVQEEQSVVWMLHPLRLNEISTGWRGFGLPWFSPELDVRAWIRTLLQPDRRATHPSDDYAHRFLVALSSRRPGANPANLNIRGAWENDRVGTSKPVAIYPPSIHPQMATQKSCFTIHRRSHPPLPALLDPASLRCFPIEPAASQQIRKDITLMGVTHSAIFPNLQALARELKEIYSR